MLLILGMVKHYHEIQEKHSKVLVLSTDLVRENGITKSHKCKKCMSQQLNTELNLQELKN